MKSFSLLSVLAITVTTLSFAQVVRPKTLLESARDSALAEKAELEKLLAIENAKNTGDNVCITNALSWRLRADQWFIDHYADFEKMDAAYKQTIGSVLQEANRKWAQVRNATITALAVKNSREQQMQISFEGMVAYLKNYNVKYANCTTKQKRSDLRRVQNDPLQNSQGIALDQVVIAAKQMTQNINASLRQTSNKYELAFSESDCGFNLVFKAQVGTDEKPEALEFNVLTAKSGEISISDADKWKRILKDNPKLEGIETDGAARLKQFANEARLSSCEKSLSYRLPTAVLGTPYQSLKSIQSVVDQEIAAGARTQEAGKNSYGNGGDEDLSWADLVVAGGNQPQLVPESFFVTTDGRLAFLSSNNLFYYSPDSKAWANVRVSLINGVQVAFDFSKNQIVQCNPNYEGYLYTYDLGMNTGWNNIGFVPSPKTIISVNDGVVFYSDADGDLYRATKGSANLAGAGIQKLGKAAVLSISSGGNRVYGILDGELVRFEDSSKKWDVVPGAEYDTFGSDLIQIQVVSPTEIYALTRMGDLFRYSDRNWRMIATSRGAKRIIRFVASRNGVVYGVSQDNKVLVLKSTNE